MVGVAHGVYPHSEDAGSIGDELILRASHDHVLYKEDNKKLYYLLAEATVSTQYAPTLKSFQRRHDGRGGYLSLISQHAGHDKWNIEVHKASTFIQSSKWKGNGNFLLETFCNKHRQAHEMLKSAVAAGIPYQLPSPYTRVGYLLDNIETSDPQLNATMAQVRTDKDDVAQTGLRYSFEDTVTTLTPSDPVARRRSGKKGPDGLLVADAEATIAPVDADGTKLRVGIGKTGVALRWHVGPEYADLSKPQRDELRRWRFKTGEYAGRKDTPEDKSWGGKSSSNISALVKKKVATKLRKLKSKKRKDDTTRGDMKAMMVSCLEELVSDSKPSAKKVKISAGSTIAEPILSPTTAIVPYEERKRPVIPSIHKILRKAREHKASRSSSDSD